MPWVTEEEIQAAKNMTAYEYLRTHQAQRLQKTRTRNEWQLTDHDSFKINELSSKWHWKSRDIGGVSALRFLIEVDGMKFTDAVKLLCEESPSFIPTQAVEREKLPFKLPERYCNCRRIRAYLNHRGISDEVITYCISHEILYESVPYHNAVFVSYDGKTDVLQGVNLKIKDGERMALVGQSGAGKSTVIELISRFYDVQEGEVLIGGKNVKELNYDTILKNVAIVFQKTFLTRDSVLENIRMGSNATLEKVRTAAKEAQIDDFIMSLPDGYDTKVGSFGSRFSGGEKQRIAIARAILKNAPILILDEATSASDPENQMEIDKAIQNLCKGKTVIVVAHRLSALKMCERVAVVENHTITCVGTHEEVRKNNAYYRKAWEDYETARNITYQLEGGEQHE